MRGFDKLSEEGRKEVLLEDDFVDDYKTLMWYEHPEERGNKVGYDPSLFVAILD